MKKFAFIGAGSFIFTRNLVRDILTFPAFFDCEIALMDINEEKLDKVALACEKIVNTMNLPAKITKTTDRRTALNGADGVLCTVFNGGTEIWKHEIEVPKKYGIDVVIGDTRSIAGIFRALQEYLFWILQVLDSGNVKYLNTNKTVIRSEDITTHIDGSQLRMFDVDKNARLVMGYNPTTKKYEFTMFNDTGNTTITLDSNGNAIFKGKITASEIEGGTITGAKITGGSIKSDTTIDVETDLRVGNNVFVGEANEASGTTKKVQFYDDESDDRRGQIQANKLSSGLVEIKLVANKKRLNALEGIFDYSGAEILSKNHSMYVTVGGVNYPVQFG